MKQFLCFCLYFIPFIAISQVIEEAGSASYYFKNTTSDTLTIQVSMVSQLGDQINIILSYPQEQTLLFEDSMFGVNPLPRDTFKSVVILNNKGEMIYSEETKVKSNWKGVKDENDTSNYYHCDYYLQIK